MTDQPATPKTILRWYHPTPGRLLVMLLIVETVLLLSERFQWFPFNEKKGWTVLIAVAAVGIFLLLMLFWLIVSLVFRWHFQFSIRSLLVLTVAVAIPCSWLAVELKRAKEQRETVEALIKLGGIVFFDYEINSSPIPRSKLTPPAPAWLRKVFGDEFFINVAYIELSNTKATNADLKHLKEIKQLNYLNLTGTQITDAGLEHIQGLNQLQSLILFQTNITDTGLEHIKGLKQLDYLFLATTRLTDVGLEHLKGLNNLQTLNLLNTQITDAGLEQLKGLKQLKSLTLNDKITDTGLKYLEGLDELKKLGLWESQVTDAGLEHLKGLTKLQQLDLAKTKVTDSGVTKLQKALPNCKITH